MEVFTEKELTIIQNNEFLIDKNKVLEKVKKIFSECGNRLAEEIEFNNPQIKKRFAELPLKISQGENYHGLPYIVMDYPRYFQEDATFSYRIIFLWGHYFNFSLHLGKKAIDTAVLVKNWDKIQEYPVFICVHSSPWEHYFQFSYFKKAKSLTLEDASTHLEKYQFIKLSLKEEFNQTDDLPDLTIRNFQTLAQFLGYNRN